MACLQTMETLDETAVEALRPLIANLPDPFVRAELNGFVDHDHGMMLASGGRFAESVSFFTSSIANKEQSLAGTDDPGLLVESLISSLWSRGWVYTTLGLINEARVDYTRAIALSDERGLSARAATARHGLGNVDLRLGNVPA
ncbi:hypothetical protein ACFQ1S_19835, partial [Kibdelosporangium lantanae]